MDSLLSQYPQRSAATAIQYRIAVKHWKAFFDGRSLESITPIDLAQFSANLLVDRSPATVNKIRRHCRALLAWGVELGRLPQIPTWRTLREPKRLPKAFLASEFRLILDVAKRWPNTIVQVPAGPWWESLLLAIWYSGGRIGAMLSVEWSDVLFEKCGFYLRAEHQKQNADQFFIVGEDCMRALGKAHAPLRQLVWPWNAKRRELYRAFRRICGLAKVPLDYEAGACFHRIRRSTASYIRAAGGDATAQLGHSSVSVTARYLDPRITGAHDASRVMPKL